MVMRVVLDTNVLVAGLRSRNGAGFQILSMLPERRFLPLLSVPLVLEYEAVLKRDQQISAHGISPGDIDALLDVWIACCDPVRLYYLWRPQLSDNDDEMVLETAINGRANGIVTYNLRDFDPAARKFGLSVYRPAHFLDTLRQRI
ncbi:putative toxin-antitoxin system toxin component, PIN family [uncultured Thiodictyon sp.]|uniref:putative toxin-antitoxin system toxin component, PIN family n=1 Tax=uncultured Thiodictyon sp. TaxID=1846217 RepID=UPI0025D1392F|nr:putative toxin-antitoxin system toxin component, PIN family [uncultured Thiodictyon sp.]